MAFRRSSVRSRLAPPASCPPHEIGTVSIGARRRAGMRSTISAAALLLVALPLAARAQTVTVQQPWARATAPHAQTGAAYATLIADIPDRLTGASSPVAATVQVHETIQDNGVMRMR